MGACGPPGASRCFARASLRAPSRPHPLRTCLPHSTGSSMPLTTLLTDFGLDDTYVGQLKGAILAVAPSGLLVDLTHAVAPQDVFAGAFLLWSAVQAFPPGTIHLAVVDPGV